MGPAPQMSEVVELVGFENDGTLKVDVWPEGENATFHIVDKKTNSRLKILYAQTD